MSLPYVLVKLIKSQFNLWHDILFARTRTHTHTHSPSTHTTIHSFKINNLLENEEFIPSEYKTFTYI